MKSQIFEFKFLDRSLRNTLVLIPGWATDYRIFNTLDLNFNYLFPLKFSPFSFEKELLSALRENRLERVTIFGWSMGGFMASDFFVKHQDKVEGLILVSIREKYEKENLRQIKARLKKNKEGYLYKFYHNCFSKCELEFFLWFKRNLLENYLTQMDLGTLLEGLDYLQDAELNLPRLKNQKIYFIHGKEDKVAPINEALRVKESLPQAKFISLKDAGHMPFLSPDFKRIFYEVRGG